MRSGLIGSGISALVVAAGLLLPMPVASQSGAPSGHPDLNGFWIDPPGTHPAKVCLGESCQAPNQPPYKAEYAAKVNEIYKTAQNGATPLDPQNDCKPLGVPRGAVGPMQILQTPQVTAILYAKSPGMEYRIIFTDGRPHPDDLDTSFFGDSIGHWEKDTFVVDVVGLNDETWLGQSELGNMKHTAIHSEKEHVIERWTRKGNTLTYEATVEDPVMFTRPWVITPRHMQLASANDYIKPSICGDSQDKSR